MKKFLIPLLLIVAIMMPTAIVEAADVPSFYKIGGKSFYATLNDKGGNEKGYRYYGYECEVDLNENFAEQFIKILINDFNFRQVTHFVNDYRDDQSTVFDTWVFTYTGSKKISTFNTTNYGDMKNYKGHLVISRKKDWNAESTEFLIYIANGLTYEED